MDTSHVSGCENDFFESMISRFQGYYSRLHWHSGDTLKAGAGNARRG
jgi:hypothetical protein